MTDLDERCFADRLEPLGHILDLSDQGCVTWSCSPIRDASGTVHVFFTRVPPPQEDWFKSFRTSGEIVHATAPQPEGPYEVHEVVLRGSEDRPGERFGMVNPRIYAVDGRYALFYTAYEIPWPREQVRENIGLMISEDLWTWSSAGEGPMLVPRPDPAAWDSQIVNNAAFVRGAAPGPYCLYYRGLRTMDLFNIGLAVADRLEGPYRRVGDRPVIDSATIPSPAGRTYRGFEDPCLWLEGGRHRMLVKDMGCLDEPGGCLFESDDGLTWRGPERAWYGSMHYWGEQGPLDSPQILFDADGRPEYLFMNRFTGGRGTGFVFRIH